MSNKHEGKKKEESDAAKKAAAARKASERQEEDLKKEEGEKEVIEPNKIYTTAQVEQDGRAMDKQSPMSPSDSAVPLQVTEDEIVNVHSTGPDAGEVITDKNARQDTYYVYNDKTEFVKSFTRAEHGDEAEKKAKQFAEEIGGEVK